MTMVAGAATVKPRWSDADRPGPKGNGVRCRTPSLRAAAMIDQRRNSVLMRAHDVGRAGVASEWIWPRISPPGKFWL